MTLLEREQALIASIQQWQHRRQDSPDPRAQQEMTEVLAILTLGLFLLPWDPH